MTLAAAFFVGEYPVVCADMLISGEPNPDLSLPAVGRVLDMTNAPKAANGLVQKVSIVAPNFAVAYAGSVLAAKVVVKALEREAQNKSLNEATLDDFFQVKHPLFERVALVGVLATEVEGKVFGLKTLCIQGSRFETASFGEVAAIGTGASLLRKVIDGFEGNPFGALTHPIKRAVASAMALTGTLHSLENTFGNTLADFASGGAYDIVTFIEGSFRRLPRHRYVIWHATYEFEEVVLQVPHLVLTQDYLNGIARIQCVRLSTDFSSSIPQYHVETHMVPPRWRTVYEVEGMQEDFRALFTVHVVRLQEGLTSRLMYFFDTEHQAITIDVDWDVRNVRMSFSAIDLMREKIRAACRK